VLADEGFEIYAIDASPSLLGAYRQRFPDARVECAAAEESDFFDRTFAGIVAWGMIFLLPAESQRIVLGKAARALAPGGKLLFTAGGLADEWTDVMTRRMSISLGAEEYRRILQSHGLALEPEVDDEGENHYYFAARQ
jgi:SAM-dependent methyltransferase